MAVDAYPQALRAGESVPSCHKSASDASLPLLNPTFLPVHPPPDKGAFP